MKDIVWIVVWAAIVGGVFAYLWRKGHLARLATYVQQTREELRKCTWPTVDELKGSTTVVAVSIVLVGAYTVGVDFVLTLIMRTVMG